MFDPMLSTNYPEKLQYPIRIETPLQGVLASSQHHISADPFECPPFAWSERETHMPLNFVIYNACPTCGSIIRRAVIDLHPTNPDAAIHSLKCADCGYEKNKVLSLRSAAPSAELTA
jgi:hypothetical protein